MADDAPASAPPPVDDEPVIKLPRGRGMVLDKAMLFRIAGTIILLVMVVVTTQPCAKATSKFVTDFDDKKPKTTPSELMPKPGSVDETPAAPVYEQLRPGMTDTEMKAAIDRAKHRNDDGSASSGSGSSAPPVVQP